MKTIAVPLRRLFLLLLLPALAAAQPAPDSAAERAFSRGAPVPDWVQPAGALPAPMPGAPLSVRLNDVQFHADTDTSFYIHRALTAHEASSLGALGQVEIEFQPDYQRVALHRLRLLRGGEVIDKTAAATIRFLQRETRLEQGLYSGMVTAAVVTDDVRVGDTLEIEYSVEGENPVFGNSFFNAAQWDAPWPVARRRVILNAAHARKIGYRAVGAERQALPAPLESDDGRRHLLTFEARAMPAVLAETALPSDVHALRWIAFSETPSWAAVNQWALALFDQPVGAAALADALRGARGAATREEQVVKVLEFVQSEIRYLSLSMGQNSHRPFAPATVLERRYGDCKDKTLLMVSMLRALGITADPVLVSTETVKGLAPMLPSPLLFDHAIVRVTLGAREYYLDPTRMGQHGPLERLGQTHAGSEVLVVAPGTTGLSTIPQPAVQPHDRRLEKVVVSAFDKPVEMEVTLETFGAAAEGLRLYLAGATMAEIRKGFESNLNKRYPDAQLLADPETVDARDTNSVTLRARFRIGSMFTASADGWSMEYEAANLTRSFYPTGNVRRDFPYAIPGAPQRMEYEMELVLPAGFNVAPDSTSATVADKAFSYSRTGTFGGRSYRSSQRLELLADRVAPADMPAFAAKLKKLNEMFNARFNVFKSDFNRRDKRAEADGQAGKVASVEEQLRGGVAALTRGIEAADLAGSDNADALCERALLQAYLGETAKAKNDAARALAQRSQAPELLRCKGQVAFVAGNFKESESELGKAIARGAEGAPVLVDRGLSELMQAKWATAAGDFARAQAASDGNERLRATILRSIASLHQGGAALAVDDPSGDAETPWLLAAAAMFSGSQTPEHMIAVASRNPGRLLDARLAEAYFYAGHYYQLKQDKLRASVLFQRAVDMRAMNSLYGIAARLELARAAR